MKVVIWGDLAYRKDMFFSPRYWRQYFKPGVKAIVDECHTHDLPVIYHGCGNARRIFDDFIEIEHVGNLPSPDQICDRHPKPRL